MSGFKQGTFNVLQKKRMVIAIIREPNFQTRSNF